MIGVRKALSTAVLARSNSRNSRRMSVEMQMTTPGSSLLEHRLGLALVRRVGIGVQEDHGNRLDALGAHVGGGLRQVVPGERLDLAPAGIDPPADAVAELARHQRRRAHDIDIVEARPVLPPDQQADRGSRAS